MPWSKNALTISCVSVEVQRSAACLPRLIFSSTGGGATTHPSRMPGESSFEKVPRYITYTPPSSDRSVGCAEPS